jgi:hypothetical protein
MSPLWILHPGLGRLTIVLIGSMRQRDPTGGSSMPHRTPLLALAALVLIVAGTVIPAQRSQAGPVVVTPDDPDNVQEYVAWHNALVGAVEGAPDTYAGVYRDTVSGQWVVALAPTADADAAETLVTQATSEAVSSVAGSAPRAAAVFTPPTVHFTRGASSAAQVHRQMTAVGASVDAGDALTKSVLEWGPDPKSGTLNIGVDHAPVGAEQAAFEAVFGDGIELTQALPSFAGSRNSDSAPWYGGDRINRTGESCTSGFSVASGSSRYELSAGHCGSGTWKVGSGTLGTTHSLIFVNNGLDTQIISASSVAGRVYDSCLTCSSSTAIKGRWDPAVGDNLCFDGSVSTWFCGNNVTATELCIHFGNIGNTDCHLTRATNTNGQLISQPGDSGGPVVLSTSSTTAYGSGTIEGWTGSYSTGLFLPLKYILPAFSVTLVTG